MKCFACDRPVRAGGAYTAHALDEQTVTVGPECWRKVGFAGTIGYQPPRGGPRLFTASAKQRRIEQDEEGGE